MPKALQPYEAVIVARGEWLEQVAAEQGHTATSLGKAKVASRQTVTRWFEGEYPGRRSHQRALKRILGVTEEQLQNGPWIALTAPGAANAANQEVAVQPLQGRVLQMKEAAKKIAVAIENDLRDSEAVVGNTHHPTELERQRALVWALKDLARWLHNNHYNMKHLFALTDEMAGEVGLPQRPNEPPPR